MTILDHSSSNGFVAGIAVNFNRVSGSKMGQNQIVGNKFLQSPEGLDLIRTPDEWIFVFQEVGQWSCNVGKVLKMFVIEVD